jgi:hypothetical protein
MEIKKKWLTAFQHPPSHKASIFAESYDVTRRRDKKERAKVMSYCI